MLQFEQQLHEGEKMNLSSSYMKVNVRTFSLGRMNLNSTCMKVNYTFTRKYVMITAFVICVS